MTEDRNPLEVALDLIVFAPVGMFITVTEELPKLVEKGRERLGSQVGMAKMMGELAAPQLQQEAEKAVKSLLDRLMPAAPPPRAPAPAAGPVGPIEARSDVPGSSGPAPGPSAADQGHGANGRARAPRERSGRAAGTGGGPAASALAIPAYDTLSAMQVVQRLSGLSAVELEAVRDYEEGHRGRKTILNRADQLLSEAG